MAYTIAHDYHAIRSSGYRPLSVIDWLVLHDIEGGSGATAAEGAGSWFQNPAVQASAHFGLDERGPIQQYLALSRIPWAAPGANLNGVHYEQYGYAHWTREQWMRNAPVTLDKAAWLLARHHKRLGIPLRTLTDSQVRARAKGVTTHRQLTRALAMGTHTDPGSGYPLLWVVRRARHYAG